MPVLRSPIWIAALASAAIVSSCSGSSELKPGKTVATTTSSKRTTDVRLSVVGTNDLHGHIEMLPIFGGYLDILRAQEERAVVLIDGGDMFQGTLASNLKEGAPIVEAYNILGYHAATIGNHEFDFGPVGDDATVQHEGQDRRGALKARAAEADFPFLGANLLEKESQDPISWPNVHPTAMTTVEGVRIGIIGITTFETPHVTLAANFVGLAMAPLAETIGQHAQSLRSAGAEVILVSAHAGGDCKEFSDHKDLSSCNPEQEIYQVANALEPKAVDVIVAGHTHLGMAHEINGIAIIESFSRGQAFGRVDLLLSPDSEVSLEKIHPPRFLCVNEKRDPECDAGEYEGEKVEPHAKLAGLAKSAADFAETVRSQPLGIAFAEPVLRSRSEASALGNLFAELMLAAQPEADIAITNGGSLRADLPKGPLRYGDLFEAMPFDNRFALVSLRGETLRRLIKNNLQSDSGILSLAGMRASAKCVKGELVVSMTRAKGKKIKDSDRLLLSTSDFIASGGDGLLGAEGMKPEKSEIDGGLMIRDAMAKVLGEKAKELTASVSTRFDPDKPRIQFAGKRPLSCSN
jgi:5'-nucleotidase